MRYNGTLRFELSESEVMNEWGEVVQAASYWSEPARCQISTISDTRLGKYEDGEFRQASFLVLCDCDVLMSERVQLERNGESLGEYRVQSSEYFAGQNRLKIVV